MFQVPGGFRSKLTALRDERRNTGVKNFAYQEILIGQKE